MVTYEATNRGIHKAVYGLRMDLTVERERFRDCAVSALILGMHTQTLERLFVWGCELIEKKWK